MVISIYVFSFWWLRSQTPTRALLLDPAGGLLSPVPLFCPPPKQIFGYAPVRISANTKTNVLPTMAIYSAAELCLIAAFSHRWLLRLF